MSFIDFFKKIGGWFKSDKVKKAFEVIDHVADVAIPIAQQLALLTPTTLDDMALAVAQKYAIKLDEWVKLPDDQKGPQLMNILLNELKKQFPDLPTNQIQTAAQIAVSIIKANSK